MADRSRGVPDAELFMSHPAEDCDSPTVEPLRIFRPQSAEHAPSDRFRYPPPPGASSSTPSRPAGASSVPARPSFPLPPGASSSAAPLPYPVDDDPVPASRPPYPDAGYHHNQNHYSHSKATPPRVSTSSPYNDTAPRLPLSPADKKPGLAERRGAVPTSLSPTSPVDSDGLFAKPIAAPVQKISTSYQNKPYYPPPVASAPAPAPAPAQPPVEIGSSGVAGASNMNRFSSTASNSTTRASRGSPPPPETPILGPGSLPDGGIEARYAAAGISGTATLNSLQGQSAAATQRIAQYGRPLAASPAPQTAPRPWTPTESPEHQPHGPPTVYQGLNPVQSPAPSTAGASPPRPQPAAQNTQNPPPTQSTGLQVSVLEQDFQRMQTSTPPPAYSSVSQNAAYPKEKQQAGPAVATTAAAAQTRPNGPSAAGTGAGHPALRPQPTPAAVSATATATVAAVAAVATAAATASATAAAGGDAKPALAAQALASPAHNAGHPAFANDRPEHAAAATPAASGPGPQSPPPLPEGWIAHLDQNSGQYYYIHLATQATQWEFPKGPNPLHHHEPTPLSPVASTYGNPLASPYAKPGLSLASPMYPPTTPGYAESIVSMASAAPTAGFTGPPPSAGVDMYKIAPSNGVYFGPYLRYGNMDVEQGVWLGSILVVTDAPQPPTIHLHRSVDLSPNPRQLAPRAVSAHQRWTFYRYDVDIAMSDAGTERWTYAVTSHLGCTRYEFVVAGRHELGWRFLAHAGNDFAPATSQAERTRLGGVDLLWKDVLQKNVECGGFHVQLGLGDQIYADRLWREVPLLQQWLAISGRENRRNVQWTARHEEDVLHAYFHYYTSHFDQPFLREAFAQIPHILQVNDHDIFDGFGSYPDYMQQTAIFKNIGRIAIEMYLLFQHHTTIEILRNVHTDRDLFTITGTGWHFVKYLGPGMVVVGPDCRSERTQNRVLAGPTYQGLFPKIALLPPSVQHCLWMISVPVVYPRMETMETLANTFQTGKKAVNTTYNLLGKVTSSVAGVVGGRDVVAQGFTSVKKAIGKSGLMGNMLNNFGEIGITEDLRDLWTQDSKDLERTYLIRTLQGIAQQKGIRMTFLSGDVHACGAGLLHDPSHPSDHKTMYQIIASPIVGAPVNSYMLKLLHNNRLLYVPQNGHASTHEASDTKEDMMEIFQLEPSGVAREYKKLMNRRNYVAVVAYDADSLASSAASTAGHSPNGSNAAQSKLSLAVDYVVQGDSGYSAPTKYGPVIVPHLEFGH